MDTVVTRCRGRETDEKYVNGRDVRRRKHTAARRRREMDKVVCLFFYIGVACVQYTSLFSIFFYCTKIGPKRKRPDQASSPRRPPRCCDRSGASARAPPDNLRASARERARASPGGRQSPPLGERCGSIFFFFLRASDTETQRETGLPIRSAQRRPRSCFFFFFYWTTTIDARDCSQRETPRRLITRVNAGLDRICSLFFLDFCDRIKQSEIISRTGCRTREKGDDQRYFKRDSILNLRCRKDRGT
jgi:hypothetical protein